MKSKCIFILLLLYQFANGQYHFGLKVGFNYPFTYFDYKTIRKVGVELGFLYNKTVTGKFGFETGLNFCTYSRSNFAVKDNLGYPSYVTRDSRIWIIRLDVDIPLFLTYTSENIELKGGTFLFARSLVSNNSATGTIMSRTRHYDDLVEPPVVVSLGMDLCAAFKVASRLKVFLEYKTGLYKESTPDDQYKYGLVETGLIYQFYP